MSSEEAPPPPPPAEAPAAPAPAAEDDADASMAPPPLQVGGDADSVGDLVRAETVIDAPPPVGFFDDEEDFTLPSDVPQVPSQEEPPAVPEFDEPEETVTFEDIFGAEFDPRSFDARDVLDVKNEELRSINDVVMKRVERIEDNETYEKDLEDIFGDAGAARQLIEGAYDQEAAHVAQSLLDGAAKAQAGQAVPGVKSVRDLEDVHNVHLISAPDGKRFNAHASSNRFFPVSSIFLTTMPTIENYQCLHMPLTGPPEDRRIKVGGAPEVLQDRKPIRAGLQGAGQTYPGAMFTPQNVVRWRRRKGNLQSNTRLLRYDNGDTILRVGSDYFMMETHEAAQENQHLMGAHGPDGMLLEYQRLRKRWRMRPLRNVRGVPNSTLSEKQRKQEDQTLPEEPVKTVRPFVEPTRDEETIEAEREQAFESLERRVKRVRDKDENDTGNDEGEAVYEKTRERPDEDEADDASVDLTGGDDHVVVGDSAGDRALAAQRDDTDPVRAPKRQRTGAS